MAKQTINLGTAPTGSGGDTPRSAFTKAQANFDELYAALGGNSLPTVLPIEKGGTGSNNTQSARQNLGLGAVATDNVVPVQRGGTGATTAAAARGALGVKTGDIKWRSNRGNLTLANDSFTVIDWTNDVFGNGGIHNQNANADAFTLPVGVFLVCVSLTFDYAPSGRRGVRLTLNNAAPASAFELRAPVSGGVTPVTLNYIARITAAGTILRVQGFQDSGSSLNLSMSGNNDITIYQLE